MKRLATLAILAAPLSAAAWEDIRKWTGTRNVCNAYGITETGRFTLHSNRTPHSRATLIKGY